MVNSLSGKREFSPRLWTVINFIFCLKKLLPTSLEEANPKRQLESRIITIAWLEVISAIMFLSNGYQANEFRTAVVVIIVSSATCH